MHVRTPPRRIKRFDESFIYSGNENPNRLLLRCYNFLAVQRIDVTYVRIPLSHVHRRVARAAPDIRYVIALGYGTNAGIGS
jgi:hypothetical protein